jgi:hypothetical protein
VVDVTKSGAYVLQYGFGVKNPEMFMTTPEPPAAEMMPPQQPMPPQMPMPPLGAGAGPVSAPPMDAGLDPMMLAMLSAEQGGQPPMI